MEIIKKSKGDNIFIAIVKIENKWIPTEMYYIVNVDINKNQVKPSLPSDLLEFGNIIGELSDYGIKKVSNPKTKKDAIKLFNKHMNRKSKLFIL
jgi:hypothetical protein